MMDDLAILLCMMLREDVDCGVAITDEKAGASEGSHQVWPPKNLNDT